MSQYHILLAIAPNALDDSIVAYACALLDVNGKVVRAIIGSQSKANPRYVLFDTLQRMASWMQANEQVVLRGMNEIVVWMPNPELMLNRNEHRVPDMTLPKRDTIAVLLTGMVKTRWTIKNVKDAPQLPVIREMLGYQAGLSPKDALLSDASRMPSPSPSLLGKKIMWNGRLCGHIQKNRYVSERTADHYCIKYRGWGIQEVIVERLQREGVDEIEIWYRSQDGKRVVYVISMKEFLEWKIRDCLTPEDGYQLFVSDDHWEKKTL